MMSFNENRVWNARQKLAFILAHVPAPPVAGNALIVTLRSQIDGCLDFIYCLLLQLSCIQPMLAVLYNKWHIDCMRGYMHIIKGFTFVTRLRPQ